MKTYQYAFILVIVVLVLAACSVAFDGRRAAAEPGEELSGGQATVFDETRNAFGHAAPGLSREDGLLFFVGNSFFNQNWVTAPASTTARDGLGPLFNARSCASCHAFDGRGQVTAQSDGASNGLLLRLSIDESGPHGAPQAEPVYGGQLQTQAILGVAPEGVLRVSYEEIGGSFADGTRYSLRRPSYTIDGLAYGVLAPDTLISPRIGTQLSGLGLLEAVAEETVLALADPDDTNGDGISGRPNYVWDKAAGALALGRFGWKANQPNLAQQTAAAFSGDMGITTPLFPAQPCGPTQIECATALAGGEPELPADDFDKVLLYVSSLAVPGRRDWQNDVVLRGKQLFSELGCASCHTPQLQTGAHPRFAALSGQTIRPYTDLLLHDMGPGLADGRPDFAATGSEWRTPPLWGIGLAETVNSNTSYLHDGRARTLLEAILWHGGEAEASKQGVLELNAREREELLAFLRSLGRVADVGPIEARLCVCCSLSNCSSSGAYETAHIATTATRLVSVHRLRREFRSSGDAGRSDKPRDRASARGTGAQHGGALSGARRLCNCARCKPTRGGTRELA
ncbi:c-type cytochrome [Candidatus Gracilibacteria bacterium]|nr:c-type cytochrome [Candidatus Gracilibacteria bacterium]